MGPSQKLIWKLYASVLGAVTTLAAQRLVTLLWKTVTGTEPPTPTDPRTPLSQALSWALASAVGVRVTQIVTQRFAARRWTDEMGTEAPERRSRLRITIG
jgi:Protein of unknown function (DUF4235)